MYIIAIMSRIWRLLNVSILPVVLWALLFNILFGVAFYYAERGVQEGLTLVDSIWWSMVTMTTVGYGDFYAQTFTGRFLISYPCMILGIGIIGYLVGLVANFIIDLSVKKRKGEMEISFDNHVIICNLPSVEKVLTVVNELKAARQFAKSRFVLVSDSVEEEPEKLVKEKIGFVKGSPTEEETLVRANITACAGVIVLAENPQDRRSDDRTFTIGSLVEMISRENGIDIKTVTELVGNSSVRNMERAAVDGFVSGEGILARLLSQEFCTPGIHDIFGQLLSNEVGSEIYIHETKLIGFKIMALRKAVLAQDSNLQVIGIIHQGKHILNPDKNITIAEGDRLVVLSENQSDLGNLEKIILENHTAASTA